MQSRRRRRRARGRIPEIGSRLARASGENFARRHHVGFLAVVARAGDGRLGDDLTSGAARCLHRRAGALVKPLPLRSAA